MELLVLRTLPDLLLALLSASVDPSAVSSPKSGTKDSFPISIDAGLELTGVPLGVPLGVEEALSTLAFLDPDLGVMLELRNDLTGVAMSPFAPPKGVPDPTRCSRLASGDMCGTGDAATLGATGGPILLRGRPPEAVEVLTMIPRLLLS